MGELAGTELSFEKAVKRAFDKTKEDVSHNSDDIHKLGVNFSSIKQEIDLLKQNQLNLNELVRNNNEKMAILVEQISKLISKNPLSSSGTSSKGNERVPIELRLIKQFQQNKANIVKNKVLGMLENGVISAYELYIAIVEQQGLCGKTSFYRYLKELETQNKVKIELKGSGRVVSLRTGS